MFGSNTGVCNVEPTPMEVVVPVSGVGQPWGGGAPVCLSVGGRVGVGRFRSVQRKVVSDR